MKKTLIVKETKTAILFKVRVDTRNGSAAKEIARFAKSGMGYCALGASGRYLTQHMMLDAIEYSGSPDLYDRLVGLGIILIDRPVAA